LVNAGRRGYTSVVQVVALALGLTSLLLLAVTRGDLIEAWRDSAPPGRPNRFIVGIQPPQTEALRQWFSRHALSVPQLYPMVRGRLMAINGEPIDPRRYADRRAQHLAEREFNMSWASELSGDNRVTAGRWFNAADHAKPVLSVEASIAETLGIEVGDALSFSSGGQTFTARVVGLRSLEWESMRPNFYVLAPPGLLDGLPTSYMCSVFVPVPDAAKLGLLVRDFPNLTVIDIAAILEQVHGLIEQVIRAVEFVFGFALLAGILVLYAALFATQDERVHEAAVLRVVGARRRQLLRAHAVEYAALGALAGALAGVAATAIAYALYTQVFELSYRPNHHVWWIGPLAGLLAVAIAGWQAVRLTTTRPPLPVLRAI
jgi:putative ABC transport system permease protein